MRSEFVNVSIPKPLGLEVERFNKENPSLALTSRASTVNLALRLLFLQTQKRKVHKLLKGGLKKKYEKTKLSSRYKEPIKTRNH